MTFFSGLYCPGRSATGIRGMLARLEPARSLDQPLGVASAGIRATQGRASEQHGLLAAWAGSPRWSRSAPAAVLEASSPDAAIREAYRALGPEFPRIIGGHFACALIDTAERRVVLAIDRTGVQPIYFASLPDGGLVFGQRLASVIRIGAVPRTLSEQSLYDYVYFHMIPSPYTVLEGVRKLAPGSFLVLEEGHLQTRDHWRPQFTLTGGTAKLAEALLPTLETAVRDSCEGAVAPGAFLSGGLDSSSVAGLMARTPTRQPVDTFSIGFDAAGYDEMAYARIASRHFGTRQHELYVRPQDLEAALPAILTAFDEPFGNSSALPAYLCARLAADAGIDRLIAGDGGDELFGGNERYRTQLIFECYGRAPGGLRSRIVEPLVQRTEPGTRLPLWRKARSYVTQAAVPLPDRLQAYNFLHRHQPEEMFDPGFLAAVDTARPLSLLRTRFNALGAEVGAINRMLYLDWKFTLADNDLPKVRTTCALAGVDVAFPMLDDRVIDLSCRVPGPAKLDLLRLRRFYKGALRGFLPREILKKRKHGFGLPFGLWMQTHEPLRALAYDSLASLKRRNIVRADFIDRAIALHRDSHAPYFGELVWILMALEIWLTGFVAP